MEAGSAQTENTLQYAKSNSFLKCLMKGKKIRQSLVSFLNEAEIRKLSATNKKMNKCVKTVHKLEVTKENKQSDDKAEEAKEAAKKALEEHVTALLKKYGTTPGGKNHLKNTKHQTPSSATLPLHMLSPELFVGQPAGESESSPSPPTLSWLLLNPSEPSNLSLLSSLSPPLPAALLKDYSRQVYYNDCLGLFIILHRSIIDPRMEYYYKENIRIRDKEDKTLTQDPLLGSLHSEEYAHLLEEFSIDKFKGIPNGMMIRHKLLTEKMEKMSEENKQKDAFKDSEAIKKALQTQNTAFVLCEGGNFSIGVFDRKGKELIHKSDHKYVVRKKQGGRQIKKDQSKGISSMGSQIRRANEEKHQQNIEEILEEPEMKSLLEQSDNVFIHAPGDNTAILFDEGRSLFKYKRNQNFRSIGMSAKKANFQELVKIKDEVLSVTIVREDNE